MTKGKNRIAWGLAVVLAIGFSVIGGILGYQAGRLYSSLPKVQELTNNDGSLLAWSTAGFTLAGALLAFLVSSWALNHLVVLSENRMKWGRWAVVAGVAPLLLAFAARPYLWVRLPGAVVTVEGRQTQGPAVFYRCADGSLLLLDAPSPGYAYVIDPRDHSVGLARRTDFPACAALAVSIEESIAVIDLTNPVKLDGHPYLAFRPRDVEFSESVSPARTCRVRVTY